MATNSVSSNGAVGGSRMKALFDTYSGTQAVLQDIKKQRVEQGPDGEPFEKVIGKCLQQVPDILSRFMGIDLRTVEVEARIGMVCQNSRRWQPRSIRKNAFVIDESNKSAMQMRFQAGMDECFAAQIRQKLSKAGFTSTVKTPQTLFCSQDFRYEQTKDPPFIKVERKERLYNVDVALLSHDYDLRISLSTETIVPAHFNPEDWTVQRTKKRTCYAKGRSMWRVDYTEVAVRHRSSQDSHRDTNEYELEFELDSEFLVAWINESDENGRNGLQQAAFDHLRGLVELCIPSIAEPDDPVHLTALTIPQATPYYPAISIVNQVIRGLTSSLHVARLNDQSKSSMSNPNAGKAPEFLGAMPVNLYRRSFLNALQTEYYLTEKTDGTRYLLYTVPKVSNGMTQLTCILIDRAKSIFTFEHSELYAAILGDGTVLDGEVVYNLTLKRSVFLVFDILCWQGRVLVPLPFVQRLNKVRELERLLPSAPDGVMPILCKHFFEKREISTLLRRSKGSANGSDHSSSHVERVYNDGKLLHHKTDGIILQPNKAYVFSRHYELLKWKWSDLRSIDLAVDIDAMAAADLSVSPDNVYLNCSGPDDTEVNVTKRGDQNVGLGVFDTLRLVAEMDQLQRQRNNNATVIAECAYDLRCGMWKYIKVRQDKTEPNYIDSVLGIFTEQAEAIGEQELEYSLLCAANGWEVDYDQHINKMMEKLLVWQRNGRK